MSYTNQTTHYGIPLPIGTDKVNGLDWNDSSEKIDAAIYDAETVAKNAATDIVTLQGNVTDLQQADIEIKTAATELTGRVVTLEQSESEVTDNIQDALDMITAREVLVAQSPIEIAVGKWFRYNGVLYVCTAEIAIGDTIVPNVNCRATNIESEMGTSGGSSASSITFDTTGTSLASTNVQNAIVEVDDTVINNTNQIAALLTRVAALEEGGGMVRDYENKVVIASGGSTTATKNGVVIANIAAENTAPVLTIGATRISGCANGSWLNSSAGAYYTDLSIMDTFDVSEGTEISVTAYTTGILVFVPYK